VTGDQVEIVQFPSFLLTAKRILDQSRQVDAPKQLGKSDKLLRFFVLAGQAAAA
jgi:hypothetical protein